MIKIIAVGKIKESFYREAVQEYQKRLSKYTKLDIIEVPDYNTDNNLVLESKEILKHINNREYIVLLSPSGKELDSIEFSKYINDKEMQYSNITFIIGGSNGVADIIRKEAHDEISFSKLTFPHQLFRVILLEQVYRAYKISNNETYHK